jgi:hypothetical protein
MVDAVVTYVCSEVGDVIRIVGAVESCAAIGAGEPGGDSIVHVNNCVADPPAVFVAIALAAYTPAVDGFPEIVPMALAIDRPGGRPDAS